MAQGKTRGVVATKPAQGTNRDASIYLLNKGKPMQFEPAFISAITTSERNPQAIPKKECARGVELQ